MMPYRPKSDDTMTLDELNQLRDAQTEPMKPVKAAPLTPITKELPAVTTTLMMPAIAASKLRWRRFCKWLNTWGPTKVLVLPTAAVVGLWIGMLIAAPAVVPDAVTPDFFAKQPSLTQPVTPEPSDTPSVSVNEWPQTANDDTSPPRRVELKTTPKPDKSDLTTPSASATPSSTPAPSPSLETPGKGNGPSPEPSASATAVPPTLPSDIPTTPAAPEETTSPAPSEPVPDSQPASPTAESRTAATP